VTNEHSVTASYRLQKVGLELKEITAYDIRLLGHRKGEPLIWRLVPGGSILAQEILRTVFLCFYSLAMSGHMGTATYSSM
jgi:hypothetical protein